MSTRADGNPVRRSLRARLQSGPPDWLPPAAAVVVATAAAALGRTERPLTALLAAGLVAVTAICPPLGLVAFVAGSLTSPLLIPTGTNSQLHFALLAAPVLGGLWLIDALRRRDLAVFRLPAVRAACALALAAGLAAVVGNLPGIGFGRTASLAAQAGGVGVFAVSALVFVLGADQLRDATLRHVTWIFLFVVALLAGGRLMPELDDLSSWLVQPGGAGSLVLTWFAALATAQVACNRALNWRLRLLTAGSVVALFAFGLGAGRVWVSGWLPPLVAVAAVALVAAPRLGIGALVAAGAVAALQLPRLLARLMEGDNRYSLETRLDAWRILAEIWAANPLLGLGPSNYYHVTPLFPIRGYNVNFSSHSTYVDLLAQTGLIGLVCFAWFSWAVARAGWRLRRRVPSGFPYAYVCGALGGLAGTLAAGGLGDWVLPFVYNVTLDGLRASLPGWLFLGGLVALARVYAPEPPVAPAAAARVSARGALLLIVLAAVVLRAATAGWLGDAVDPISGAADQVSYDALAQRLLEGSGFSFSRPWYPFTAAGAPTSHWSFLYTAYLAGVYGLVGHHPLAARLLQAIVSGIGCWLICRIGGRLFGGRVGLAAAGLMAVYAYFVFFAAALMTQTLYILALLAAVDRAQTIADRPTTGGWAALGVALGVGTLLRQTLLLYTPLLLAWLLWRTRARWRWRDPAIAIALIAACVLPWTVRNYAAFGDLLLLNSNGGFFLWASNHPDQGRDFDPGFVPPLPPELRGAGEPAIDRELTRRAIGFVVDDPVRFVQLSLSRVGWYFDLLPSRRSSSLSNVARLSSFTVYLPFMVAGVLLSLPRWRACLPLYLYVAADTALHLTSWSAPRYRLPSDALMMVFAGLAVVRAIDRLRRCSAPPT